MPPNAQTQDLTITREKPVETIVQEIKRSSNDAILEKFVDIKDRLEPGNEIWDTAYFTETIG